MRASLASWLPLRLNARLSRPSALSNHNTSAYTDSQDLEKYGHRESESSEEDDYSCPSSPGESSTRCSFDSHPSDQPMLRRKSPAISYRYAYYRMPRKIVNSICFVMIFTLVIFIG